MCGLRQDVLVSCLAGSCLRGWRALAAILSCALILATIPGRLCSGQSAGLAAAYSFAEGSGALVSDASGNGNTGQVSGATWTAGRFDSALHFNGAGALVTVKDSASLDLTKGMTLEAWVYPTSTAARWKDVIYKGPDDTYYLEGSSPVGGVPGMGGTFSPNPLYGRLALWVNSWTHLAATYDGAAMRLYVNGIQVNSRAQSGPIQTSTGALTIGGDPLYGQYWTGRIDEVRIYNRALSAGEIQSDMKTPVKRPDEPPVASASAKPTWGAAPLAAEFSSAGSFDPEGVALTYHWALGDGSSSTEANPTHGYTAPGLYICRLTVSDGVNKSSSSDVSITVSDPASALAAAYAFEEGDGAVAGDASGNGNAGTVSGARWTTGRFGGALEFDGTGALVVVNDSASLDLTAAMTLEAWVYPTSTDARWKDVIYKGPEDTYYLEGSSPQEGAPAMGGVFSASPLYGTAALPLNAWTHLAATYDGAAMRLYVNGVQVASRAQSGPVQTSTGALTIGGDPLYGQYWTGRIDEVRIYNWALSAVEIQSDMITPLVEPTPDSEPIPTPDPLPIPALGPILPLAWNPVTTDVAGDPRQIAGYRIYVAVSGSPYRLASTTEQPFVELGSLLAGTVYVVGVKAFDIEDIESDISAPVTVLMPSGL